MNRRKKQQQQGQEQEQEQVAVRARLVKADELAAREAAREAALAEAKAEAQAKAADIAPALKRTPRNATEARNMFEALFNRAA